MIIVRRLFNLVIEEIVGALSNAPHRIQLILAFGIMHTEEFTPFLILGAAGNSLIINIPDVVLGGRPVPLQCLVARSTPHNSIGDRGECCRRNFWRYIIVARVKANSERDSLEVVHILNGEGELLEERIIPA